MRSFKTAAGWCRKLATDAAQTPSGNDVLAALQTVANHKVVYGLSSGAIVLMGWTVWDAKDLRHSVKDLGERIDRVETSLGKRIDRVETSLGQRIEKVETSLGQRIEKVEERIDTIVREMHANHLAVMQELGELRGYLQAKKELSDDSRSGTSSSESRP